MTTSTQDREVRTKYERWLWESLKLIGGASIAAIVAVQLKITEVNKELEKIRDVTSLDIKRLHESIEKLQAESKETQMLMRGHRETAAIERREIEALIIRNRDDGAQERKQLENKIEAIKDLIISHEIDVLRNQARNNNGDQANKRGLSR